MVDLALVVPFNDLEVLERVLTEHAGRVAGMIMEPLMMNAGIVPPQPGYLEGVRELTRRHDVLLAFDEVKTGLTVSPGGATAALGVTPDIICLAKALGGGLPVSAIGGTAEVMGLIADGTYEQVGTFNGNPLAMAATRANLTHVLDEAAYAHLDALAVRAREGFEGHIAAQKLPWHVVSVGAKGCVAFAPERVRNYRDFLRVDDRWGNLHWLMQHNGGVFLPPWGKVEQWLLSVQHSDDDVDRLVANFGRLAEVAAGTA
jgi:glutamate-1-semialdehyde 2,1-aminomutase